MSARSGSSRGSALGAPASALPSIASSELYSRVEALELQLVAERKRRREVERAIQRMAHEDSASDSKGPPAASDPSVLKELSLFLLQNSSRSVASAASSARSGAAVASSTAAPIPRPPALVKQVERLPDGKLIGGATNVSARSHERNSAKRNANGPLWEVPRVVKPPLPPQAKGNSSWDASPTRFSKKKADAVDVYICKQRHERRMQALMEFQLTPL